MRFIVFFLICAILVNVPQIRDNTVSFTARNITSRIFSPLQLIINSSIDNIVYGFATIVRIFHADVENKRLKKELDICQAKLKILDSVEQENFRLRSALNFSSSRPYKFRLLPAEVIGRNLSSWNSEILIDKGSNKGIRKGMNVIDQNGLVGKVLEVYPNSSKVSLIIGPDCAISSLIVEAKTFGVTVGGSKDGLKLKYIPGDVEIGVDNNVIVSAASGSFYPGIPIGKIKKISKDVNQLFQEVWIEPFCRFDRLSTVFLVY
jgi:rod shape-determining protein MreC